MSKRTFVDIDEVYSKLLGEYIFDDEEVLIPLSALRRSVAAATALIVPEPNRTNEDLQN